jgi:hypothetical protein
MGHKNPTFSAQIRRDVNTPVSMPFPRNKLIRHGLEDDGFMSRTRILNWLEETL